MVNVSGPPFSRSLYPASANSKRGGGPEAGGLAAGPGPDRARSLTRLLLDRVVALGPVLPSDTQSTSGKLECDGYTVEKRSLPIFSPYSYQAEHV